MEVKNFSLFSADFIPKVAREVPSGARGLNLTGEEQKWQKP